MEEDVQYTTVVFNHKPTPRTANRDEVNTVYSEVARKLKSANSAPAPDILTVAEAKPEPVRALTLLTAVAMCLCVLLLGCIAVITYLSLSLTNQSAENRRLSSRVSLLQNSTEFLTQERERLEQETARLENQTAELQNRTHDLIHQRDQFNWTLQVITSDVSKFCPRNKCQQCLAGWLHFEDSCYLFYDKPPQWKTWNQSQSYCRTENPFSDLVIIDSLQEQEFIHDHIKYYHDKWHGFWIGLSNQSNIWVWVDGQPDTLGFWMTNFSGKPGPKVLVIPKQNLTTSWAPAEDKFENKFICESKALTID